jgi:transcriptional regulator with XRE-family HTH domain
MFNKRLREKREAIGVSQRGFAKKIGISPDLYNKYEQGVSRPSYEALVKIANNLGISIDYLVGETDAQFTPYVTKYGAPIEMIEIPGLTNGTAPLRVAESADVTEYETKAALYEEIKNMDENDAASVLEIIRIIKKLRLKSDG